MVLPSTFENHSLFSEQSTIKGSGVVCISDYHGTFYGWRWRIFYNSAVIQLLVDCGIVFLFTIMEPVRTGTVLPWWKFIKSLLETFVRGGWNSSCHNRWRELYWWLDSVMTMIKPGRLILISSSTTQTSAGYVNYFCLLHHWAFMSHNVNFLSLTVFRLSTWNNSGVTGFRVRTINVWKPGTFICDITYGLWLLKEHVTLHCLFCDVFLAVPSHRQRSTSNFMLVFISLYGKSAGGQEIGSRCSGLLSRCTWHCWILLGISPEALGHGCWRPGTSDCSHPFVLCSLGSLELGCQGTLNQGPSGE